MVPELVMFRHSLAETDLTAANLAALFFDD